MTGSDFILVLNAGSSSLKFGLFDGGARQPARRCQGQFLGLDTTARLRVFDDLGRRLLDEPTTVTDHAQAEPWVGGRHAAAGTARRAPPGRRPAPDSRPGPFLQVDALMAGHVHPVHLAHHQPLRQDEAGQGQHGHDQGSQQRRGEVAHL